MANKKRLIDANALKALFDERYDEVFVQEYTRHNKQFWNGLCVGVNWGRNTIADASSVDAVELKCKVGDYVYALWEAPVKLKYIIYCTEVKEIRVSMRNCRLTTTYILEPIAYRGHRKEYRDEDFGTLVFKEEEDAERKLYPCEHCISGTYRSCDGCSYGERKDNGSTQV